jgi:CheY-like chemotaxis protein
MPKHILLVDDETAVRGAVAMLLSIDGHTVTEAGSGDEAIDRFGKETFDLVITDFKMPGMTGAALAAAIKRLSPAQPIIMVTAHEAPPTGPANPVDAVLNKPFMLDDLRRVVGGVGKCP